MWSAPSRKVYKCPPAPLEFVLLLDDDLRRRRLRDRIDLHYLSPFPDVFQGKPVARIIRPLLDARSIRVTTEFNVKEITDQTIRSHEGRDIPFDLAVLVPPHRVAAAIEGAGLAPEGWVPVNPRTLGVTGEEHIFALGDTVDLPIPNTGAVAHFQAPLVPSGLRWAWGGRQSAGADCSGVQDEDERRAPPTPGPELTPDLDGTNIGVLAAYSQYRWPNLSARNLSSCFARR